VTKKRDPRRSNVKRVPLKWAGGKVRQRNWIIDFILQVPHKNYVEPFGGGASVLLGFAPDPTIRRVYNDIDGDVVNFFRVLRDRPDDLIRAIALTPFSEEEYELSRVWAEDELEQARRTYVRTRQRFPTGVQANFYQGKAGNGWLWNSNSVKEGHVLGKKVAGPLTQWQPVDYLYGVAEVLRNVEINNNDWRKVIQRYDSEHTVFYVDPPYLKSSMRSGKNLYGFQFDDDASHAELAEALHNIQGVAFVSAYPSPLYDELYAGWTKHTRTGYNVLSHKSTEVLWSSYQQEGDE
jgi:DNA adenine methylase